MDTENIESGVDRRDDDQDESSGSHDPLALQILLEAFEGNIPRGADDQDSQEAFDIVAEALILTQKKEHRLHEVPKKPNWYEKYPEKHCATLEVDRKRGWLIATGESLRAQGVESGCATQRDTPP